jgi:hypothetical protein
LFKQEESEDEVEKELRLAEETQRMLMVEEQEEREERQKKELSELREELIG